MSIIPKKMEKTIRNVVRIARHAVLQGLVMRDSADASVLIIYSTGIY